MQQAQVVNFDLTPSNKERTKGQTGCIPTKQLDLSSGTEQSLQDSLYDRVRMNKNKKQKPLLRLRFNICLVLKVFLIEESFAISCLIFGIYRK